MIGTLAQAGRSVEYENLLREMLAPLSKDWSVEAHDEDPIRWYTVNPKAALLPVQGWKIHVSAGHAEAESFCQCVLPFLVGVKASFKIPRDVESFFAINSGAAGASQVGKILTVYGSASVDLAELARELSQLWSRTRGPKVPSDLQMAGARAVFLRYGAIATRAIVVDRLGRHAFALRQPDGSLVPDQRSSDGSQPSWCPPPPVECEQGADVDVDTRFHLGDESFLPMVLLNASFRARTYLGISLVDGRSVVLKTANPGIPWDLTSLDSVDLLNREHDILVAMSADGDLSPRPLGFARGSPAVLAVEDLRGDSLEAQVGEGAVELLPHLAEAIANLHESGYVHRDLKLSNAVAVNGSVRLVDFGLAARIGQTGISGGTRNYMPPEGTDGPARPSDDLFSFGVAVAHAFLEREPATFPAPTARVVGLLNLLGHGQIAGIVQSLLSSDPEDRPSARSLTTSLTDIIATPALCPEITRQATAVRTRRAMKHWCFRTAHSTARATRYFFEGTKNGAGWWRNSHFEAGFACEGINLGAAGIILGLISIDQALQRNDFASDVARGSAWLAGRPPSENAVGLLAGDAGVALALAVAGGRYQQTDWMNAARARLENAAAVRGDYDLFAGVAGVLYAAAVIAIIVNESWPREVGQPLAERLVAAGQILQGVRVWPSPDDDQAPFTGVAHGSAGVALALAEWSRRAGDPELHDLAVDIFRRLAEGARSPAQGGLVRSVGEASQPTDDQLWCHGAAGYLWSVLMALHEVQPDDDILDWAAQRFLASSLLTCPVYCHGLAGQLELCGMLRRVERFRARAHHRAARLVATLRLLMERRDGLTVWSAEGPEMITPDLWVGFLGPAVALARYAAGFTDSVVSPEWLVACSRPINET
jgi:hypothetical protein